MIRFYVVRWEVIDGANEYCRHTLLTLEDHPRTPQGELTLRLVLEDFVRKDELDDAVARYEKDDYVEVEGGMRVIKCLSWDEIDQTTYETLMRYT